jgi:membrane-bound inhibitor of C-type lysozyme
MTLMRDRGTAGSAVPPYTAGFRGQTDMNTYRLIVLGIAIAGTSAGLAPALAQSTTVQSYHCADGTNFIVGFFPYDKRAHLEIDGGEVTLRKRLSFSDTRYAGGGVTLRIAKSGAVTVKHAKRPVTACNPDLRQ